MFDDTGFGHQKQPFDDDPVQDRDPPSRLKMAWTTALQSLAWCLTWSRRRKAILLPLGIAVMAGFTAFDLWVYCTHPVTILDFFVIQIEDDHGKDIANAKIAPKRLYGPRPGEHAAEGDLGKWPGFALLKQHQDTIIGIA